MRSVLFLMHINPQPAEFLKWNNLHSSWSANSIESFTTGDKDLSHSFPAGLI